jgi:hypothetical protein
LDPRYYLAPDSAKDLPYADLLWSRGHQDEIWVSQDGKGRNTLSEVSPLIQSISNAPVVTERLCFPKEIQDLALTHLKPFVAGQ